MKTNKLEKLFTKAMIALGLFTFFFSALGSLMAIYIINTGGF